MTDDDYKKIKNLAHKRGIMVTELLREFIDQGLQEKLAEENLDLVASVVRQQLDAVMKPHIERLASISSKAGHMSATSTFLNAQALVELVPKERQRDIRTMYENARKKAVEYMRVKTSDFDNEYK
ncbi:MAG: hypothetical protein EOM07_02125 [Clostridia bacterium]|nr:hypothetical protein [Clostridia bacterium]